MWYFKRLAITLTAAFLLTPCVRADEAAKANPPNILYIMADDHAAHAISAYGSKVNQTPNIDRIGREGMILDNCFATNALCAPSRATILTSKYSHLNGVLTHHDPPFDSTQLTYPKVLQKAGYQTAVVGKWHLKSDPTGFDYWCVFPGQGAYYNPPMIENGKTLKNKGYATDLVTDYSIKFLEQRDKSKPFLLISQHKAPHRPWQPDEKHAHLYDDVEIPKPDTYDDDYTSRATPARLAKMRIEDLTKVDTKGDPPAGLTPAQEKDWKYQRYMKDYLRCIASVDDNVGRLLDYLKAHDLLDNTLIIYTSDQGFFLGDHDFFDKRFMYEESLRMPFLVRYPREIKAGTHTDAVITNLDFAPTLLDFAGLPKPEEMQGRSFRAVLDGKTPADWPTAMYYHFHEYPDADHMAARHYGIRDGHYKLIHYYFPTDEWELFDLEKDPKELRSVYGLPEYASKEAELKKKLQSLRVKYKDNVGPAVEE